MNLSHRTTGKKKVHSQECLTTGNELDQKSNGSMEESPKSLKLEEFRKKHSLNVNIPNKLRHNKARVKLEGYQLRFPKKTQGFFLGESSSMGEITMEYDGQKMVEDNQMHQVDFVIGPSDEGQTKPKGEEITNFIKVQRNFNIKNLKSQNTSSTNNQPVFNAVSVQSSPHKGKLALSSNLKEFSPKNDAYLWPSQKPKEEVNPFTFNQVTKSFGRIKLNPIPLKERPSQKGLYTLQKTVARNDSLQAKASLFKPKVFA